jgi:hypothetical protein
MRTTEKYFGRIIFPESNVTIENIWLIFADKKMYVELPEPDLAVEDWGVIWGEFNKLGTVTLIDCGLSGRTIGFGGNVRKLAIHKIAQGVKLTDKWQKFISHVSFTSLGLNDWTRLRNEVIIDGLTYTLPSPNDFLVVETKEFVLKMTIYHQGVISFDELHFKRTVSIDVRFKESVNVFEFFIWKKRLEKLIVFLTNEDPKLQIVQLNNSQKRIFGVDSIWQSQRFSHSIDFEYFDLKNHLETIVQNWFSNTKLIPIVDLIMEKKENPELSIPRYFLNVCVASESFHKNFISESPELIDKSNITNREKIKLKIQDDEELLAWFRRKSNFWKNPELYDRLMNLSPDYEKIVGDIFKIELSELIRKIKRTRDKLAHEGKSNTEFKNEFELFIIGYSLEMLLQFHIIKILGVNDENLLERVVLSGQNNVRLLAQWNNYEGIESNS